jgi:hypothetical protein
VTELRRNLPAATAAAESADRRCHDPHRHGNHGARDRSRTLDRATKKAAAARTAARAFSAASAGRELGRRLNNHCRLGCGSGRGLRQHALWLTGVAGENNGRNNSKHRSEKTRLHVSLLRLPNKYCGTRRNNLRGYVGL